MPTLDGGYWPGYTSCPYTGQILTGTPTTTSFPVSTASYPVHGASAQGLLTYVVQMTSGAANGQTAMISTNTATNLTLYSNGSTTLTGVALQGLTTAPSAGDTFNICTTTTPDGLHPTIGSHVTISTQFQAWLAKYAVPFGSISANNILYKNNIIQIKAAA
jgi:hypothetical protein